MITETVDKVSRDVSDSMFLHDVNLLYEKLGIATILSNGIAIKGQKETPNNPIAD